MATRLKNLKIKKVDFVDEGANPDAHIRMLKKKDGEEQTAEEDSKKNTGSILKKLFGFIGKAAGMNQEEIDSAMDEIQKGDSVSFNEKINEVKNYKIADEMWDTCYALQSSLCSVLNDEEMDSASAATAMQESLDEFYTVVKESIKEWSSGKSASIVSKNEEVLEEDGPDNNEKPKGDGEEMKIDKSKLTDEERDFLESIEKRCGIEDEDGPVSDGTAAVPASTGKIPDPVQRTVTKSVPVQDGDSPVQQTDEAGDIYKGLHPAVRAELESLKKFHEEAEDKELAGIAKKYAIIGKTEAELIPLFKNLKAAGGTAYNDMISVLDQAVCAVEKSGAFTEIGKSGHGGTTDGGAWSEAEAKAVELMKSRTGLSKAQALDEVFVANPELAERCEKED